MAPRKAKPPAGPAVAVARTPGPEARRQRRFTAAITRSGGKCRVVLPFDPDELWGSKERHYVYGELDRHQVRGVLVVAGGQVLLPVGAAWLRDTQVPLDTPVRVVLWPEGPQVENLAADLAGSLAASPGAATFFASLPTFYRKNFLRWIDSAKKPQTRQARIAEMVRLLAEGKKQR